MSNLAPDAAAADTNDFSKSSSDIATDMAFGLDNHQILNQQPSLFESASNVITKAVPLTGAAIVNSFYNTGVELVNFFGGDASKLEMKDYGFNDDYLDYYSKHAQGIEATALIGGSFIPGLAAVKALKLIQAGKATSTLARATGFFKTISSDALEDATAQITAGDGGLFGSFTKQKMQIFAGQAGDQALQALSFQVATLATMKASPLLDKDGYDNVVSDLFFGTLTGGAVGGMLEGWVTSSLIKKALLNADVGSKFTELAKYMGKGAFAAGDRVMTLLDSVDQIDTNKITSTLEKTKYSGTTQRAYDATKKILVGEPGQPGIIKAGDNELAVKFMDTLLSMKKAGMEKEDMYNLLGRLTNATRVNDDAMVNDGDIFYFNRIPQAAKKTGNITFSDINTPMPRYNFGTPIPKEEQSGVSLGYKLAPGSDKYSLANFKDTFDDAITGKPVQKYKDASEAFADGHDVYLDRNFNAIVNPDSTNLVRVARPGESRWLTVAEEKAYRSTGNLLKDSKKSLMGAPVVFDSVSGAVKESVSPVVGDFGPVKLLDKGLNYGGNFSPQSLSTSITAGTTPLDANARHVWFSLRGIKAGDELASDDVAALEQLVRQGSADPSVKWEDYISRLEKKGVTFDDGTPLPQSRDDAISMVKSAKDNLITDILSKNADRSSEDISRMVNVKEDYVGNGLKGSSPADYMLPIEQSAELRHMRLWYDIGNTSKNNTGQIMRGMEDVQYRISVIKDAAQTATTRFLSAIDVPEIQSFFSRRGSESANIQGVGSTFLGFSKAGYDTLGQEMERIGRVISDAYQERVKNISTVLTQSATALRNDQAASAEAGLFRKVRLSTNKDYVFLPEQFAEEHSLIKSGDQSNVAVLKDSLIKDRKGNIIGWDNKYTPEGFINGFAMDIANDMGQFGNSTLYRLSDKVSAFERANLELNNARVQHRNAFYTATGINRELPSDILYAPPLNTANFRHFAYVKMREGMGMADSDATVITAETADDLRKKIAMLEATGKYSIFTKDQIKDYHQIVGDYEYSRNFSQTQVNSSLQRDGILNDISPPTRGETIVKDYVDWHSRQEMMLLRDYTELGNGQLFAELRAMGSRFTSSETSKFGFVARSFQKSVENPYESYIKTALAISPKETYRLWSQANDVTEAFFDSAFRAAKNALYNVRNGVIDFDKASTMAQQFGLGNIYGAGKEALDAYYGVTNKLPPQRYLSKFTAAANTILGATTIKLDTFQQMIHILSTPILTLAEANSAKQWLETQLPGSSQNVPATSKVFFKALSNYFTDDGRQQMIEYRRMGLIHNPDTVNSHFQLMEQLSLPWGSYSEGGLTTKINNAMKVAQKLTGTEFSEALTSWMGAETGRLIFEKAGYTGQQLMDNVMSFANRVKGNVVASQRPVAFQGPLGQAIGLFQTYQFNMMQQLFKYVENGEGKTLAILAGMQSSLFGLSSLPGFQAINNHIVGNAASNPSHKDMYSTTYNLMDKTMGDWLLYGTSSNWPKMFGAEGGVGLYSRGDMNPRQITLLPVNPLEWPAVSGGIRLVSMLAGISKKIADGGSIPSSILTGIEHNGLSRPLQGMAALAQGYATTGEGSLVSQTRPPLSDLGWNDIFSAANFGRLLGARPLDEAVVMDAMYRRTLYQAKTNARIERLGEAVKTNLMGNDTLDSGKLSTYAADYAAAGGQVQEFGRSLVKWSKDTKVSVANELFRSLKNPNNQQMMQIMGGQPLPDQMNKGDISNSPTTPSPKPGGGVQ